MENDAMSKLIDRIERISVLRNMVFRTVAARANLSNGWIFSPEQIDMLLNGAALGAITNIIAKYMEEESLNEHISTKSIIMDRGGDEGTPMPDSTNSQIITGNID